MTPTQTLELLENSLAQSLAGFLAQPAGEMIAPTALLDSALRAVKALEEPLMLEEAAEWLPWILRWFYSCEHQFAIFQHDAVFPAPATDMRRWRAWIRQEHRGAQGLTEEETPANRCGPLERLELALLQGPLREAAGDPTIGLAWAGSALQEQNLPLFKAFDVDVAMMHQIMGSARSLFLPKKEADKTDDEFWNKHSTTALRQHENSRDSAGGLWLEWVNNTDIHSDTLLAMVEAGVFAYKTYDCGTGWMGLARTPERFDTLIRHIDPLDPQQPLEVRLSAFQGLGPAVLQWMDHETVKTRSGHVFNGLLDHAKQRWLEWKMKDQQLSWESWQCQAMSHLAASGDKPNHKLDSIKAMEHLLNWKADDLWTGRGEALWFSMWRCETPLPRWVFPNGTTMTYSAGFCRAALPSISSTQLSTQFYFCRKPKEEAHAHISGQSTVVDDAWRFLFHLGRTMTDPCFLRSPFEDADGGRMLGEALMELFTHRWEHRPQAVIAEDAVVFILSVRGGQYPTFTAAFWEGFDPYLPQLAYQVMEKGHVSIRWTRWWLAQPLPTGSAEAILQARTLVGVLARENPVFFGEAVTQSMLNRLTELWSRWPQFGPQDEEPYMQAAWGKATVLYPGLETAWRKAHLQRTLSDAAVTGGRARL